MAKITFLVTNEETGEQTTVLAGQADLIALERQYGIRIPAFEDVASLEHMAFLSWNAMRRQKLTTLSFDEWIEAFESEQPGKGDDDEDDEGKAG